MSRSVIGSVTFAILVTACTAGPTGTPSGQPTISPLTPTTVRPFPLPTLAAAVEFGDGTYRIGTDLQAGTYRLREPARACYWERVSGSGGTLADVIAFDNVIGYSVVTVAASDQGFTSQGCGTWSSDLSAVTSSRTEFVEGTFIVGVDMEPGTYRAGGGNQCYWQRLSGFGGTVGEVIDGDVPSGTVTATIADRDRGFRSYGCGSWRRE